MEEYTKIYEVPNKFPIKMCFVYNVIYYILLW